MVTRGIRNNNPANLRKGAIWLGLSDTIKDTEFATFDSVEYGIRALIKTIRTYVVKHKLKTIDEIINRFAPSSENNTNFYITYVKKVFIDANISSTHHFTEYDVNTCHRHALFYLCKAICKVESQYILTYDMFRTAFFLNK